MKYKVKIITGFRQEQAHSIDAEEAHKAYYLFLHPTERGVFDNGLALRGSDIQKIEADYQGTMEWNSTHLLDDDDWNEIRAKGVDRKLRELLSNAQTLAKMENPHINKSLSEASIGLPKYEDRQIGGGMKRIGELM